MTSVKDEQPKKVLPPILVRVGGSVISVKDVHSAKAYTTISASGR